VSGDASLPFRITAILFPIFAIVAAGYFYARRHKPEMAVANRLNMDVFVPALVFAAMAGKSFDLAAYGPLALGALLLLLTCGLAAWPVARLLGVPAKTFVPPMLFNNSGNIGLPLAVLAWGEAALPAAVILFMVENTLHFSLGARLLDPRARLLTLWRIPVVAAAVAGLTLFAAGLLGLALWLLRQDIAWRTVRQAGLTRYIAFCLLAGYGWLFVGGLLGVAGGFLPGSPLRDATLHAIGLGFVFSMIFGHGPLILPALARVRVAYHPVFYGPLVVLHVSLVLRVAADLGTAPLAAVANAAALALFILTMITGILRGRTRADRALPGSRVTRSTHR